MTICTRFSYAAPIFNNSLNKLKMTIDELIVEIQSGLWKLNYTCDLKEEYPIHYLDQVLWFEIHKPLCRSCVFRIGISYETNTHDLFLGNLLNKNVDTIIDLYDRADCGFHEEDHIFSIRNIKGEDDSVIPCFIINSLGFIDKIKTLEESIDFTKVQHLIKVIKDYFNI